MVKNKQKAKTTGFRQFLTDELVRRQKRNPSYSMNAFARDLGLSSSRFSEILNTKVGISESRAAQIADKLQLSEKEKNYFIDLVQSEHARSAVAKKAALGRLRERFAGARKIEKQEFFLVSDWHNLAFLELLNVKGIRHTVNDFASYLGLREEIVQQTLERLTQLGYIAKEGDVWVATEPDTTTDTDIPSEAIRNYHKQILVKAQVALERDPVDERDFSSLVFAMDRGQIGYAKERIREFRRSLVKELEDTSEKDSVYCFSLQFFNLLEKK
ncbi:MAG: DUF4423 domain-containing protein [Bdellovibrio sp.]|nr:DUF4423 domain-containing protein [Bdellovibrio sp.]